MKISNFTIQKSQDITEVSATIDSYRMWFRVPAEYTVSKMADPFLAVALLPAMSLSENIEIDTSIRTSSFFLHNLRKIQDIFHNWNPKLKIINIKTTESKVSVLNKGTITFFSGGVDSTYTFLKNIDRITHIINIHGFDFFYPQEYKNLHFSIEDIKDLSQFARRIMFPKKPVAEKLNNALPLPVKNLLMRYIKECLSPIHVEKTLINVLNELVKSNIITKKGLTDAFPRELIGKYDTIYQKSFERNTTFATSFNKKSISIETNHYAFGYRYNLSRNLTCGSCLGSISLLLCFPLTYIPSSYSYEQLAPTGTHPLLDPLWVNECTSIIHDGCEVGRTGKIKAICNNKTALNNLRVCFDECNDNCGKCEKCLRTMIPMEILGVRSNAFPPLPPLKKLRKLNLSKGIEVRYLKENIDIAREFNHPILSILLLNSKRNIRKSIIKNIIYTIDILFFKGKFNVSKRKKLFMKRIGPVPD